MPIKKAAFKSLRQGKKRRRRNVAAKSKLKSFAKKIASELAANNIEEATKLARDLARLYDRAAAKGIIPKRRAGRKQSRLMRKLAKTQLQH